MKLMLSLALLLCISSLALAQEKQPKVELFGGFSYVKVDADERDNRNFYGWNGAVSINSDKLIGITIDVSQHYQDFVLGTSNILGIHGGPRFVVRGEHATTFIHVLLGGSRIHDRVNTLTQRFSTHDTSFSMLAGGGVDVNLTEHLGVRLIQAEYDMTTFKGSFSGKRLQHNLRVGIGFVFRFGK